MNSQTPHSQRVIPSKVHGLTTRPSSPPNDGTDHKTTLPITANHMRRHRSLQDVTSGKVITASESASKRQRIELERDIKQQPSLYQAKPPPLKHTLPNNTNSISTSNRFEVLSNLDSADINQILDKDDASVDSTDMDIDGREEDDNESRDQDGVESGTLVDKSPISRSPSPSHHSSQVNSSQQSPPKGEHVPPITVYGVPTYRDMTNLLTTITEGKFTLSSSKDSFRIKADNLITFDALVDAFRTADLQFFTFPRPDQKLRKLVIRGLSATVQLEDIKEDLTSQGFRFVDIRQLFHRPVNGERRPMPLFVVATMATDSGRDNSLANVERICHHRVSIEKYRGPQGPRQCYNCQAYGHSSSFCNLPPACFKCARTHASKDCTKPATTPAECINCKGDHPASSRRCPVYLRVRDQQAQTGQSTHFTKRLNKKSTSPQLPTNLTQSYTRQGLSYATATSTKEPSPNNHNSQPPPLLGRTNNQPSPLPPHYQGQTNTGPSPKVWALMFNIIEAILELPPNPIITTLARMLREMTLQYQNGP